MLKFKELTHKICLQIFFFKKNYQHIPSPLRHFINQNVPSHYISVGPVHSFRFLIESVKGGNNEI